MRITRRDLLGIGMRAGMAGLVLPGHAWAGAQQPTGRPTIAAGKQRLIARSLRPPDYEAPVALLDSWVTPTEHFFVRCHMPPPTNVEASKWSLAVDGEIAKPASLTLAELKAMPAVTLPVTLECAGNGRAFFEPPVAGIQWAKGAVGNARWTGVRLAEVLKRVGIKDTARFIHMHGGDRPVGTMPAFIRQLPLSKAMHPDTLLVYDMNGQPLPLLHGFPLRTVVPGWEGAYSVKWLSKLQVATSESDSFWVATAYRYPTRRVAPGAAVDAKDMAPVTGLVVKSLLTRPLDATTVGPGRIAVGGFAWAGDTDIKGVEISLDHGASWRPARLVGEHGKYAWRRFEYSFQAMRPESYLIMSRATDAAGRTQPISPPWNPSGYLWNAPDAVRVAVKA